MKRKVVLWWNIPCSGMIGVLKEYARTIDPSAIVVTGCLSKSRKAMGWDDAGKMFDQHVVIEDDEWESRAMNILKENANRFHVFNGLTHPHRMHKLIYAAMDQDIAFCNMSEAYANLERGIKKPLKDIYLSCILPSKIKPIAQKSKGVLCLSGGARSNLDQFERFGFPKSHIFPYGYYTDEKDNFSYEASEDGNIHILCPGLLEPYKGVDILIKAVAELKKAGICGFVCHITGNGSQMDALQKLSSGLAVDEIVKFEGVLNSHDYGNLLKTIDVLVAPGRVEPWGIRINEAIQRGNVVIVSDGIGASDLIRLSNGGAVFESGNEKDLAAKMARYLTSEKELMIGKNANLKFKDQISCTVKAEELHRIIKSIQENAK